MSRLLAIRKYLSVDQLLIYATVFEQTVQSENKLADAVAELEKADGRPELVHLRRTGRGKTGHAPSTLL